jgi:DNA polymerase I
MAEKIQVYAIEHNTIRPWGDDWKNNRNGKTEIILYGRDGNKQKIIKKYNSWHPYFYIEISQEIPEEIFPFIFEVEKKKIYTTLTGEKCSKIFIKNPDALWDIRKVLDEKGVKHFELDVIPRLAFTLDYFKHMANQYTFDIDRCRMFIIDIETTTRFDEIDIVNTPEDITMVTFYDNYTNKYYTWSWRKDFTECKKEAEDKILFLFNDQIEMLKHFVLTWKIMSPDIITHWNGNNFDMPYILGKCKQLGIPLKDFSPSGRAWIQKQPYKDEIYCECIIYGVASIDAYKWYKEVHLDQLRSFSLDNVAKAEGLGSKEKINITNAWETDWDKLYSYNINDVLLTKLIIEKRKILDFVSGIRKVSLGNFSDLVYFSRNIDLLLLQQAREENIILPTKPKQVGEYKSKDEREAEYVGAVVNAKPGIYRGGIATYDFSALYPNIIRTFNISYEKANFDGRGIEFEIPAGADETGNKMKVYMEQDKKGITPTVIERLTTLREKYEIALKESKTIKEAEDADQLIQATKNLILTLYGAHAMSAFRLFKREVASTITHIGRTMIREMIDYSSKKGLNVIYTDTDSVYIQMNSEDVEKSKEYESELNQHILDYCKEKWNIQPEKNYLKIKFEKISRSVLIKSKKTYACHVLWKKGKVRDDISITGMQAKRSDSAEQVQYLQPKVIELILRGGSNTEIEKLIFEEIEKIKHCDNYEYISVPTNFGKSKYENNLPKTRGADFAKKLLNLSITPGQKVYLLYTKMESDALCFESNVDLKDVQIKVDIEKMIERNILNALEDILTIWIDERYYANLKIKILLQLKGQQQL